MKRPLGIVALLYGCGLAMGEISQPPLTLLFFISLAVAAVALLVPKLRASLLWPLVLLAGWTNLTWRTAVLSPHDLRALQGDVAELTAVRGELAGTPSQRPPAYTLPAAVQKWHTLAQVRVTGLRKGSRWQPATGQIAVSTPGVLSGEFRAGQTVEIEGVLAPPPGPAAEGLFDYRAYLRRHEIYYQLKTQSSNDWRRVASTPAALPLNDRFVNWARTALARGLPFEDQSLKLEWALSLGDRTVLTEDAAEPFVRAATYHIFAVDGLRMAILFGIFFALLRVLRLPRALVGILLIPLIWFYTELTGWPASAIRASVMLTILFVGWALKRPSDMINSLFAAALIILIWDPQQLFQAGFQLSFFVVLSIVLVLPVLDRFFQRLLRPEPLLPDELRPRWQRWLRLPARYLGDLLITSCAAWVGSIPLVAYYFHIVTPVSTPANLVAVPLCGLVLTSNFLSLLLSAWFPGGAELFNHAGWFLMDCIRVTSRWFAGWPCAYCYVPAPDGFTIGLYYGILLASSTGWLFESRWRAWKLAGLVLLLSIGCWRWQREWSAARLTLLPLAGGSAAWYNAPGARKDLLVDCGNTNAVEFILNPFLRAQGVNRLSCLALTHGDLRQIGGAGLLDALLPIRHVATSSARFRSPTWRQIVAGLEHSPDRRRVLTRGDRLGDWVALHPDPADSFAQADDNALVLLGTLRGTRLLLLSDLGAAGQRTLLERVPDLRADIVAGGLPQNSEPMSDGLLDAIRPKVVIVMDSEYPATRRAGAALRARLARRGIPVLCTRDTGAVTIEFKNSGWKLRTMSGFLNQSGCLH